VRTNRVQFSGRLVKFPAEPSGLPAAEPGIIGSGYGNQHKHEPSLIEAQREELPLRLGHRPAKKAQRSPDQSNRKAGQAGSSNEPDVFPKRASLTARWLVSKPTGQAFGPNSELRS
jgi:hypothetical protein